MNAFIDGYEELSPAIRQYITDYSYLLYDISRYSDDQIRGEARLRILFSVFRDIYAEDPQVLLDTIERAQVALNELEDKATGLRYFETYLRYIFNVGTRLTKAHMQAILEKACATYPEGSDVFMTLAEILREEGRAEGKAEGKAELAKEIAKKAFREGMEIALIAKLTGLSKDDVEKLAKETD